VVHPHGADPAAWNAFVRAVEVSLPKLQLLVVALVRRADADDLVGDTLLAATKHWRTYNAKRPMIPWLWTIAKRLSRRPPHADSVSTPAEGLATDPDLGADPAYMLEQGSFSPRVERALNGLTASQRLVLLKVVVGDDSLREVADDLGISANAVECLLRRARRAFKEAYGTEG
jgi:RNA polymerase sigma-70 factor (ECF subfamily)